MKKNKTAVIIITIVVLLVLAAGAYKLMHHMQRIPQAGQSVNPQSQAQQMSTQKKSLFDFFSMTGSQKCTFSDSSNNSSGTVYIGSGKMRGDFHSQSDGKTEASHMINDGSYIYMWTDGQQNGYKMSLAVVKQEEAQVTESPSTNTNVQPSQTVNMQQKSNYSCGPWNLDASVFTLPTKVTFTDYSSMMQGVGAPGVTSSSTQQGAQTHGSAAMCAQCNQAPAGAARNQCLAALHCQ